MSQPSIERFSSRTHPLDKTVLTEYLKQARRYHRIAGYFTSSLFEVVQENFSVASTVCLYKPNLCSINLATSGFTDF